MRGHLIDEDEEGRQGRRVTVLVVRAVNGRMCIGSGVDDSGTVAVAVVGKRNGTRRGDGGGGGSDCGEGEGGGGGEWNSLTHMDDDDDDAADDDDDTNGTLVIAIDDEGDDDEDEDEDGMGVTRVA